MVLGAQAPGRVGRRRITSGGPRERPSSFVLDSRDGARRRILLLALLGLRVAIADAAIVAACDDPEIPRWTPVVPKPYTEEDAPRLPRTLSRRQWREARRALVRDRRPARASSLGAIGIWLNGEVGDLGYWVARRRARPGLRDARGAAPSVGWALDELELPRAELDDDPDNVASQRVAEKGGFAAKA